MLSISMVNIAVCFITICSLDYHERDSQMLIDKPNLTDCLIIKGYYSAITVAVFGYLGNEEETISAEPSGVFFVNLTFNC